MTILAVPMLFSETGPRDEDSDSAGAGSLADSTARLRDRIAAALLQTGYASLRRVRIHVHEGLVRLNGQVGCFYHKQVASEAVLRVPGVDQLHNELDVASVEPARESQRL